MAGREGRVHRFKGYAVRKNVASAIGPPPLAAGTGDIWDGLFDRAAQRRSEGDSDMTPYWVFNDGPARIERYVPVLPFSRDAAMLPNLRKSRAAYRLAFGQPSQEELVEFLGEGLSDVELADLADQLRIDLSPPVRPAR